MAKKKLKLTLELIPRSTWGISLAQLLPVPVWDAVRREVYTKSHYLCEICGVHGVPVHSHEVWEYDDRKRIQKLIGFSCLCEDCHALKHMGRTIEMAHAGKLPWSKVRELEKHFCVVNECTMTDYAIHSTEMRDLNFRRSKKNYKVDWGIYQPEKIIERWKKLKK